MVCTCVWRFGSKPIILANAKVRMGGRIGVQASGLASVQSGREHTQIFGV
jgi:hypothetical protein